MLPRFSLEEWLYLLSRSRAYGPPDGKLMFGSRSCHHASEVNQPSGLLSPTSIGTRIGQTTHPSASVTPETDQDDGRATYAFDPHLDPQLQWAGKAEHTSFQVPTVSLHVHERIDPRTIIDATRKRNGNGVASQGSFVRASRRESAHSQRYRVLPAQAELDQPASLPATVFS